MSKSETPAVKPKQKRKSSAARRAEIADFAAELFATEGFHASTRKISAAVGVTQATLYKHFSSKDELIEEVFKNRYLKDNQTRFSELLMDTNTPIHQRISDAYTEYYQNITSTSLRLFQRASYDGLELAHRFSPHLDKNILWPIIEALRYELHLPDLKSSKAHPSERNLALMLHSTIVFLAIRKHVYHIDFKGGEPDIIRLHVQTWLLGAQQMFPSFQSLGSE